jgi:ABC-type thiamin/hydroxymethylpyrimidine transport system permease subunit
VISLSGALFLSSFVLVPAALLAFVRPMGRRVFLVLGLAVGLGAEFVLSLGGPDSPALVTPLIGFGVALGALLVELIAFVVRTVRARRAPG